MNHTHNKQVFIQLNEHSHICIDENGDYWRWWEDEYSHHEGQIESLEELTQYIKECVSKAAA